MALIAHKHSTRCMRRAQHSKPTINAGMSHAPVCRKSQQALTAAASIAASAKPAPHLVVLRVKRKRGDASVDSLLVSTDEATSNENDVPDRKRRAGTETIEDTLAFLSINKAAEEKRQHQVDPKPSRLFYKRVRTTESDGSDRKETTSRVVAPSNDEHGHVVETAGTGGGRLDTRLVSDAGVPPIPPPPDALDYLEVRRIKARAVGTAVDSGRGSGHGVPSSSDVTSSADFHVIDLQAVGRRGNGMDVTDTADTAFGGKTAATPSVAPVLNPVERQMDEAIFEVRGLVAISTWVLIIRFFTVVSDTAFSTRALALTPPCETEPTFSCGTESTFQGKTPWNYSRPYFLLHIYTVVTEFIFTACSNSTRVQRSSR